MAKRKKKKVVKNKFKYKNELYGIILILCGILGLGKFGPVGRAIASFGLFLVGSIYMVLLIALLVVGGILLIKREWPDFFSSKLLGIYLFVLGLLVVMHNEFIAANQLNLMIAFQDTMSELTTGFNQIMNGQALDIAAGGGIIGASFGVLFAKLFSFTGMSIVAIVLMIAGILVFTGFSVVDFIRDKMSEGKEKAISRKEAKESKKARSSVIINDGNVEEEEVETKKVKISNINELKNIPLKEVAEEKPKEEKVVTNKSYQLPPISLLNPPKKSKNETDQSSIEKNIEILERVLKDFGITGKVVEVHIGPAVAQYELEIASGTRVNRITSIDREIALALAKKDVKIQAPIPGKSTVGIEFANDVSTPVSFYEIMDSKLMRNAPDKKLMVPLGKSIMGDIGVCEVNKMPHLLIAGTTGSGKSVCVNGVICSILMRARPDEVKLVMVDPKVVELSVYNGVPHLMCPVVTDPKRAAVALAKMVNEMENRYQTFSDSKTKNIDGYNDYLEKYNKEHKDEE